MAPRKAFLLRLEPAVHDELQRWANAEMRSVNGQIEYLLRRALQQAGRLPKAKPAGEESHVEEQDESADGGGPDGRA